MDKAPNLNPTSGNPSISKRLAAYKRKKEEARAAAQNVDDCVNRGRGKPTRLSLASRPRSAPSGKENGANSPDGRRGRGGQKPSTLPTQCRQEKQSEIALSSSQLVGNPLTGELQFKLAMTQLLQWQFIHAQARMAFGCREECALSQLAAVVDIVVEKERIAADMARCNQRLIRDLDAVVDAQLLHLPLILKQWKAPSGLGHSERRNSLATKLQEASETVYLELHGEEDHKSTRDGGSEEDRRERAPPRSPLEQTAFDFSLQDLESDLAALVEYYKALASPSIQTLSSDDSKMLRKSQSLPNSCRAKMPHSHSPLALDQAIAANFLASLVNQRTREAKELLERVDSKARLLREHHIEVASLKLSSAGF